MINDNVDVWPMLVSQDGAELKTKDGNMNVELGDGKRFCVVSGGKATCVDELALESEVRDAVSQSKVLADKHAVSASSETLGWPAADTCTCAVSRCYVHIFRAWLCY